MKVPEIEESITKELVEVSYNEIQFRIVEFVQKKQKKMKFLVAICAKCVRMVLCLSRGRADTPKSSVGKPQFLVNII